MATTKMARESIFPGGLLAQECDYFGFFSWLSFRVAAQQPAAAPLFEFKEVMIPMRDGVHLQTVILTPVGAKEPLPILLERTPYGVPEAAPTEVRPRLKELMEDGYIFVYQNLRGRFKSEGVFNISSQVDLQDPKATSETTDAYDTIEWLVKNVPGNNGKVGILRGFVRRLDGGA